MWWSRANVTDTDNHCVHCHRHRPRRLPTARGDINGSDPCLDTRLGRRLDPCPSQILHGFACDWTQAWVYVQREMASRKTAGRDAGYIRGRITTGLFQGVGEADVEGDHSDQWIRGRRVRRRLKLLTGKRNKKAPRYFVSLWTKWDGMCIP